MCATLLLGAWLAAWVISRTEICGPRRVVGVFIRLVVVATLYLVWTIWALRSDIPAFEFGLWDGVDALLLMLALAFWLSRLRRSAASGPT